MESNATQFVVKNEMIANQFGISDLDLKLKNGSLGLFPTDTLPALCSYPKYSKKIWTIKKRPLNKPLILMGGCLDDLFKFVHPCAIKDGLKLARTYWPGALTIVMPTVGDFYKNMNLYSNSLGFRIPALTLARELLLKTGPLATTSANLSGAAPVRDAKEASLQFPGVPLLGPNPWPKASGMASTVVEWEEGKWNLLRTGSIVFQSK